MRERESVALNNRLEILEYCTYRVVTTLLASMNFGPHSSWYHRSKKVGIAACIKT